MAGTLMPPRYSGSRAAYDSPRKWVLSTGYERPEWKHEYEGVNIFLWVLQGLLALVFLAAGGMKVIRSKEALRPQMGWVESSPAAGVKLIGAVEIVGAAGLILPGLLHIAVILTPLAALGLVILMVGAVVTHLRRGERVPSLTPLVLAILSAVVAVLRFGPYHF